MQVLTNCIAPDHAEDVVRLAFDVTEQRHDRNAFLCKWQRPNTWERRNMNWERQNLKWERHTQSGNTITSNGIAIALIGSARILNGNAITLIGNVITWIMKQRGLDALDYFSSSWKSKPTLSYSCLVKRMFQTGVVFIWFLKVCGWLGGADWCWVMFCIYICICRFL
jgi:hypothetical protein